jgi:hypothetical protein
VLLDFGDDVDVARFLGLGLDPQRVVDLRQMARLELDVEHRADDRHNLSERVSHMCVPK